MSTQEELLAILNSHCQQSLGPNVAGPSSLLNHGEEFGSGSEAEYADDDSEEEWQGINPANKDHFSDSNEDTTDHEEDEDDFVAESNMFASSSSAPRVVVYNDPSSSSMSSIPPNKSQMKAFMSSKISKLRQEDSTNTQDKQGDNQDDDDDRTNLQNDALLHQLVHTKLLSGSLNPDLDLTPAQRRKALAGRVLELAGSTKLGKGEDAVRKAERNKASKRVRDGLGEKIEQRKKARVEEAKNLGNYHPVLKKLYDTSSSDRPTNKKRERGLAMGVGKFSGGILKLGKDEINKVQNLGRSSSGSGRGKGRRGRGRGK